MKPSLLCSRIPPPHDIIVISLEEDVERRAILLNQLPLTTRVLRAVDTRESIPLSVTDYHAIEMLEHGKPRQHHRELTRGAIGCYMSHMKAWTSLTREAAFIFEDDARLTAEFSSLCALVEWADPSWDIFLLGYASKQKHSITSFLQTHAYVIRRRSVEKILQHMYPIRQQLDWQLSSLARSGIIRIEGARHQVVIQDKHLPSRIHP